MTIKHHIVTHETIIFQLSLLSLPKSDQESEKLDREVQEPFRVQKQVKRKAEHAS